MDKHPAASARGLSPPSLSPCFQGVPAPGTEREELKGTAAASYFRISAVFFNQQILLAKLRFIKKSIRKGIFSCQ